MPPEIAFAPLPVRRRGTLEILDTALKLYRRYFGVLLGWSALAAMTCLVLMLVQFGYLIALPLVYGSVGCCVAAAVRGQKVTFSQAWEFTKPRYGALIGLFFLSSIIIFCAAIAMVIAGTVIFIAGFYVLQYAPTAVRVVMGVLGYIGAILLYATAMMIAFVWQSVVLFVVCLEDDKRNTSSLGRAWQLLKGRWKGVFGLSLLLTLAWVSVLGIIFGLLWFFVQAANIAVSDPTGSGFLGIAASGSVLLALFFMFWLPGQAMVTAVLYLDLRVRKEALDLEWTAYASAQPLAPDGNPSGALTGAAIPAAGMAPMGSQGTLPAQAMMPDGTLNPSAFGATGVTAPPPPAQAQFQSQSQTSHPVDVAPPSYPTTPQPVAPPSWPASPDASGAPGPVPSAPTLPPTAPTVAPPSYPVPPSDDPAPVAPTPTPFVIPTAQELASSFAPPDAVTVPPALDKPFAPVAPEASAFGSAPTDNSTFTPSFSGSSFGESSSSNPTFGSSSFGGSSFGGAPSEPSSFPVTEPTPTPPSPVMDSPSPPSPVDTPPSP